MPSKSDRVLLREKVTTQDLASLFVISERQIQRLTVQGVLKLARNSKRQAIRGRYVLGDSVAAYVKHLRESLNGDPNEARYLAARARRMDAIAEQAELELQVRKGQLHRAGDVEFCLTNMITFAKQRMLAIPSRTARLLVGETNFRKIYSTIDDEIRLGLTDLSEANYREMMAAQCKAYLDKKIMEMQSENGEQDASNESGGD